MRETAFLPPLCFIVRMFMECNWTVVLSSMERSGLNGAAVVRCISVFKLPLQMSHHGSAKKGGQPPSKKLCFYLRVFKVNLDRDNYSAVSSSAPSLFLPPHQLLLHLPPLPSFSPHRFLSPLRCSFPFSSAPLFRLRAPLYFSSIFLPSLGFPGSLSLKE